MTDNEAKALLDNQLIVCGLVAQGHIPRIESMLAKGVGWAEIGSAIGWCPDTAREHYGMYLMSRTEKQ